MQSYFADPCCTADWMGFTSSHSGAEKDDFFQNKRAMKADTPSGRKRESALPAWTEIFLYKYRRSLASTIKGKSPKMGEALATAQLCQHCRAAERSLNVHRASATLASTPVLPPSLQAGICWLLLTCSRLRGGPLQLLNKAEPHHI